MTKIALLASNFQCNAWLHQIDRLPASSLASPFGCRELSASIFSSRECNDGFQIEQSRESRTPVTNEWYYKVFQAISWSVGTPVDTINLKLSTLLESLMAIHKAMFDTICSKVDQFAVREFGKHQVLNQLTLVGIIERGNGFQFEGTTEIDKEVNVQFLPKALMCQANLKLLNCSVPQNLLQSGTVNRFMKNPPQQVVDLKSMMNHFVGNLTKLILAVVPQRDRSCNRHRSKLGKKMLGQKNVS
jgi:hypothetical protein